MTPSWGSVRLVATDLDGTLLRTDGSLSEATRRVVRASAEAGLEWAFLTARPLRGTREMLLAAGLGGSLATSNGAVCLDLSSGSMHYEPRTLTPDVVGSIADWARSVDRECVLAVDSGRHVLATGDLGDVGWPYEVSPSIPALARFTAFKVLVRPSRGHEDLVARARAWSAEVATVTMSTDTLVEFCPPRTDKAHALRAIARQSEITLGDVLAIGDMPNDEPMLRVAGIAATVANGHPSLKEVADVVTASNDDDGVARLVELVMQERASGRSGVRRSDRTTDNEGR